MDSGGASVATWFDHSSDDILDAEKICDLQVNVTVWQSFDGHRDVYIWWVSGRGCVWLTKLGMTFCPCRFSLQTRLFIHWVFQAVKILVSYQWRTKGPVLRLLWVSSLWQQKSYFLVVTPALCRHHLVRPAWKSSSVVIWNKTTKNLVTWKVSPVVLESIEFRVFSGLLNIFVFQGM